MRDASPSVVSIAADRLIRSRIANGPVAGLSSVRGIVGDAGVAALKRSAARTPTQAPTAAISSPSVIIDGPVDQHDFRPYGGFIDFPPYIPAEPEPEQTVVLPSGLGSFVDPMPGLGGAPSRPYLSRPATFIELLPSYAPPIEAVTILPAAAPPAPSLPPEPVAGYVSGSEDRKLIWVAGGAKFDVPIPGYEAATAQTASNLAGLRRAARATIASEVQAAQQSFERWLELSGSLRSLHGELAGLEGATNPDALARRAVVRAEIDSLTAAANVAANDAAERWSLRDSINQALARLADKPLTIRAELGTSQSIDLSKANDFTSILDAEKAAENKEVELIRELDEARLNDDQAWAARIEGELKRLIQTKVLISKQLGGIAAELAAQKLYPGATILYNDATGSGGPGEADLVIQYQGRVVVLEAKGGSSWLGGANTQATEGRAEQASLAHTFETALKMGQAGEAALAAGDVSHGQALIEAARQILAALKSGKLDFIVVSTDWVRGAYGISGVGPTTVTPATMRWW